MNKPVKDHLGQTYSSMSEMCRAYDLPLSTFHNRILRGWSLEQALTIENETTKVCKVRPKNGKVYKDHLGNTYTTVGEMCDHYGIPRQVYFGRLRNCKDWTLKKILTEPVSRVPRNVKHVTDHKGIEYQSISEMCRTYGIRNQTYRERIKLGFTVEQALTTPVNSQVSFKNIICQDHLGNTYRSLNEMCRHYNVTRYQYQSRIKLGWSVEKALTTPYIINNKECIDYKNQALPTLRDMAQFYGIPTYRLQGKSKENMKEYLIKMIKSHYKNGKKIGSMVILDCIDFPYFLVQMNNNKYMVHFDDILNEYHKTFNPLPETKVKNERIEIIRLIKFPYYLVKIDGNEIVQSYWQIIQFNVDTNFGLKKT